MNRRSIAAASLVAVAALATPLDAQRRSYEANGFEPVWHLSIGRGRIVFESGEGPRIDVAMPVRESAVNGHRYVTRQIVVRVVRRECEDESARVYADTVTVQVQGRRFEGCGGEPVESDTLAETYWPILDIDGAIVSGGEYVIEFGLDRLSGRAGCNRFSGPFRQEGDRLTVGPLAVTRMACPPPRMAHERRVLEILRAGVTIARQGGNAMVLRGANGAIRIGQAH